mgnify:CR=1 FL=1
MFDEKGLVSNTAAGGSSGSGDAVGQGSNSDGSYTLTIPGDAFTNIMTTQLNLQITKTDSADASKLLEGAKFTLKEQGTENSMEVTTDKDGIATFTGIQWGATYELRETKAPSNYMTAGPWILEVGDEDATLYPATENTDGTLTKTGGTGTPLTVSGTERHESRRIEGAFGHHPRHFLGLRASRHRRSRDNLLYRRRPDADPRRGDPVVYPLQASKGG